MQPHEPGKKNEGVISRVLQRPGEFSALPLSKNIKGASAISVLNFRLVHNISKTTIATQNFMGAQPSFPYFANPTDPSVLVQVIFRQLSPDLLSIPPHLL